MSSSILCAAEAPSNIALIKYMGKTNSGKNRPTNSSLSYTLEHLRSRVEISPAHHESWEALEQSGWFSLQLSSKGQNRFLQHWRFLKEALGIEGQFFIRSANNFPSDCGLASSASSFAALTMAAQELAVIQGKAKLARGELADLSRQGSGSSCRSFFSPWSVWDADGARGIDFHWQYLNHQAVVVDENIKTVSSSEAHQRVTSSALFVGRPERAEDRRQQLMAALVQGDWKQAFSIVWAEFWDMHALFETSHPVFGYMTPTSLQVLRILQRVWEERDDGPLVTMDAGANIHLLYRPDQAALQKEIQNLLPATCRVLGS